MSDIPTTHRIPEDVMRALEAPSPRVPVELLAENARLRDELAEMTTDSDAARAEAEMGEVAEMLRRMIDHADAFDHGEAMPSYGADVEAARALLSRIGGKP